MENELYFYTRGSSMLCSVGDWPSQQMNPMSESNCFQLYFYIDSNLHVREMLQSLTAR